MNRPDISRLKRNRSIYLKLGFIISISLTIMAFNYTVYDVPEYTVDIGPMEDEELIDIQRTVQEKKKLPPPASVQPSTVIEKQEVEFIDEPKPEPIVEKILVDPQPLENKKPVSTKIPEAKKPDIQEEVVKDVPPIHKFVQQMPRFPGCETEGLDEDAIKKCAEKKLLEFLGTNIKYPSIAKENNIEGTAVITFVVEKDGSITDLKIVREIGGGCGKEVIRVANKMPNWIPGEQFKKKVRVQFSLPVKFTLN